MATRRGAQQSIMIVEDEPIVARDLASMVGHLGYRVSGVADRGAEAIALAEKERPDLAFMDIGLPGELDGIETATRIRKNHRTSIVYLTAFADRETVRRAKRTEPLGYILKPFGEREIQAAIETALCREAANDVPGLDPVPPGRGAERLPAILASMTDAVIATDSSGRVEWMNPAAALQTGWSQEEAVTMNIDEVFVVKREDPDLPMADAVFQALREGGSSSVMDDVLLISRGGTRRPITLSASSMTDPAGEPAGAVLVFSDRSLQKDRHSRQLLERKMEAVGALAGGVAHDYSTMVGVILGFARRIRQGLNVWDPLHKEVSEILVSAQKCTALAGKLLTIGSRQFITPISLNLNETLNALVPMLRSLTGNGITIEVQPGEGLWLVSMDPSQVAQIISLLVTNAGDAISGDGQITIATRNLFVDDHHAGHPSPSPRGEFVELSITDNGRGMAKHEKEHLFEPFFTTKTKGGGHGLGLALVFGIVRQNRGFITAESEPGSGTTFRIAFPRSPQSMTAHGEEIPARGTETILLVEDEKLLLTIIGDELESLGYTVLQADSPEEGIVLFEKNKSRLDIVVTDVIMPGMNGKELFDQLSSMRPGLKVIFISGHSEGFVAERGILENETNFLQKPFTPLELARRVRAVMDR